MEFVDFEIIVTGSYLRIIPKEGFKDNSIYEIKLIGINSLSGDELSDDIKLVTSLSPMYVDLYSVKTLIGDMDIPDDVILYHIREASRFADYIRANIDPENIPFEVAQFVRYKAAHECILRHTVNLSSTLGQKGTVGKVTFEERETTKDVSKLLDHICKEIAKWLDEVKGFKLEGRAQMKTAVRGGSRTPGYDPIGLDYKRGVDNDSKK